MHCALAIDQLSVDYTGTAVLKEVSCTARDGDVVALVGPNGAGKSTLLRAIAAVRDGATAKGSIRGNTSVSYCPDATLGFLDLSIAENIELLMLALDWDQSTCDDRREDLIALVGLPGKENETLDRLSSGMRRRLDIVLSVAKDADLYLFDEPYKGLDAEWVKTLSSLLQKLRAEGKATVVATHAVDLLLPQATQLWTLDGGRLSATPWVNKDAPVS